MGVVIDIMWKLPIPNLVGNLTQTKWRFMYFHISEKFLNLVKNLCQKVSLTFLGKKTLSLFFEKNNLTITQILAVSYKLYITLTLKLPHIVTFLFFKIRKSFFLASNGMMHHNILFCNLYNVNFKKIDLMHGSASSITSNETHLKNYKQCFFALCLRSYAVHCFISDFSQHFSLKKVLTKKAPTIRWYSRGLYMCGLSVLKKF